MLPIFLWRSWGKAEKLARVFQGGDLSRTNPRSLHQQNNLSFMNLPRKVEMMRLLLIAVIIQTVKHMLKNEAAFPLLSRVTRTPTSEVQKARASFPALPVAP